MRFLKTLAAAVTGLAMLAAPAMSADVEFTGSKFTCLEYTNGLGENASGKLQSVIAHVWIHGYLSGYYKASQKLNLVDDTATSEALDNSLLQTCREWAQRDILGVSLEILAKADRAMPAKAGADFSPVGYTCEQHTKAKAGAAADANRADIAELWAFAFIQGYKNLTQPELEVPVESKPQLTGAINNVCLKNAGLPYMDIAALVSEKVKLQ
ncbi:MAG: hypothetical protein AB7E79_14255 [Rhodospirillaceae bacterium]